jgi:hypothetical protein
VASKYRQVAERQSRLLWNQWSSIDVAFWAKGKQMISVLVSFQPKISSNMVNRPPVRSSPSGIGDIPQSEVDMNVRDGRM